MVKKIALGISCFLMICLIVNFSRQIIKLWGLTGVLEEKRVQLTHLEEGNQRLERKLEEVADPAYVEYIAREKLGMTREGEQLIVISEASLTPSPAAGAGDSEPVWEQWWRLFFP